MLTYADVCWRMRQLDELECALRTLGIEADEEELSKMIRDIDADGSGSVDFGEFLPPHYVALTRMLAYADVC
jgi:Ca2+-binding EF-hand superfamily protein